MCQTGSMRHTLSRSHVPWMDRQMERTAGWSADLFRFLRNCREGRGGAFRPTLAVFLLTHISAIFFPYRVLFYTVYSDYASLASRTLCKACFDDFTYVCVTDDDCVLFLRHVFSCTHESTNNALENPFFYFRRRVRSLCLAHVAAMCHLI